MKVGEGVCYNYDKNTGLPVSPLAMSSPDSSEEVCIDESSDFKSGDIFETPETLVCEAGSSDPYMDLEDITEPDIKLSSLNPATLKGLTEGKTTISDSNGNQAGTVNKNGNDYTIETGNTTIKFSDTVHSLNNDLMKKIIDSKFNGDVVIKNDPNNGGREVAVFMPKNLTDNPPQVNYYFHGMHSQGTIKGVLFGGADSPNGIMDAVQKGVDKGQVFVIAQGPHQNDNDGFTMKNEANSKATYSSPINAWFMKGVDDFSSFRSGIESDIRQKYGIPDSGTHLPTTYSGHSAGGQVMLNILQQNTDNLKDVKKVVNIDGSYGSLYPEISMTKGTGTEVYYYHNTNSADIKENTTTFPHYHRISGEYYHYGSNSTAVSNL